MTQAAFHMGPSWAPVGPSRAPVRPQLGPTGAHLGLLLGEGLTFLDVCPSFRCHCSGGAQQRVSNAVVYLMQKHSYVTLAYIDDFCGVAHDKETALSSLGHFGRTTDQLGLSLATEKTAHPTTRLEFLGLMFDNTRQLIITIPEACLKDVLDEAGRSVLKTSAPRQDVPSLVGKLNFIATCVRPARKFMGHILVALRAADEDGLVSVSPAFKKDLSWFINFARGCNRRIMLEPALKQVVIESDACLKGGGDAPQPSTIIRRSPRTL